MSSVYVRDEIKTFLDANSSEDFLDLTDQYEELQDFLTRKGIGSEDDWVGLDFIGSDEEVVGLHANNTTGRYRETGAVFIHVVARAIPDVGDLILPRIETLRDLLRGRRINDVVVESVTPPNTKSGATLQFEGGYQSGSFIVNYYRDINL